MHWLIGDWSHTALVAAKAALMYATALGMLRIGERRTMAQWTIIDFATAIALGAIIGRTATAKNQSYVTGAVAIVVLITIHRVVSLLRFARPVARVVDHRVRVLVEHGRLRPGQLRKCGITENDLFAHLRQRGVFRLDRVRYVIYESKGDLTIVPEPADAPAELPLVLSGLRGAADFRAEDATVSSRTQEG